MFSTDVYKRQLQDTDKPDNGRKAVPNNWSKYPYRQTVCPTIKGVRSNADYNPHNRRMKTP